jgi:hypothetical protein
MKKTTTLLRAFTVAAMCLAQAATTTAQNINTTAGTGVAGFSGDGGPGSVAQFRNPSYVITDASYNIYIADYLNQRVRKIDASGNISTIAGSSSIGGFGGDGGPATAALLYQPYGIALDPSGNLYISDYINHHIRKVDAAGIITSVAGGGSGGYTGDGGAATAALIKNPTGICTDAAGNVYFAEETNNIIRKITVATGVISTVAGNGTSGYAGDGAAATAAQLQQPKDVAIDAAGNLYIADWLNHRIRKVSTTGIITTICGTGVGAAGADGSLAVVTAIDHPLSVKLDASGNILFYDSWNNRIRKINAAGIVSTVAGNGSYGYSGDGGAATAAKIASCGIFIDATDRIVIADNGNHRIRIVTPAPIVISGTATMCAGNTTTLTASVTGGTWSSSAPTTASVDAAGIVTGIAAGTATISYIATTGTATKDVTVNATPAPITGTPTVCIAATTTLSSATSGGSWISFNPPTASISATGVVTGNIADTVTIAYFFLTGCYTTTIVTVDACTTEISQATQSNSHIDIYPNPAQSTVSISCPNTKGQVHILVTDMLGKDLIHDTHTLQSGVAQLHISDLPAGSYIVKIISENTVATTRLLKTE